MVRPRAVAYELDLALVRNLSQKIRADFYDLRSFSFGMGLSVLTQHLNEAVGFFLVTAASQFAKFRRDFGRVECRNNSASDRSGSGSLGVQLFTSDALAGNPLGSGSTIELELDSVLFSETLQEGDAHLMDARHLSNREALT